MSLDIPSPKKENTMDKKSLCEALMMAVKFGDKNKAKSLIKQGMLVVGSKFVTHYRLFNLQDVSFNNFDTLGF